MATDSEPDFALRHAVVLAAGSGSRMGRGTHKALIEVHNVQGTLHLILNRLARANLASVTVVTGAHEQDVTRTALDVMPEVRVTHNPRYDQLGPVMSLRTALQGLADGDVCTFNADTVLLPDFLESLWSTPHGVTAITIHRGNPDSSGHDVGVLESDGRIIDIGPDLDTGCWMGPCVMWAHADRHILNVVGNTEKQWQVVAGLIAQGHPVAAIEVPSDSFFDIDTEDDLRGARQRLAGIDLGPDELLFRRTVSKDEHPVGRRESETTFVKTCPDVRSAATEFTVLKMLGSAGVDVPRPLELRGEAVTMELIEGIRVFDLLRLLRQVAPEMIPVLMGRLRSRLALIQSVLFENRHQLPAAPYPFGTKVVTMLRLLSLLLDVPAPTAGELAQWAELSSTWHQIVDTPFRDATTKNMILALPALSVSSPDRLATLERLASSDPEQLLAAPVVDVDFSLCGYRTTAADDWVSLLMHEATAPWTDWPRDADLDFDAHTLGLTLLVRYVRFGGRKMSYSLMHPGAAAIRFAYDDAGFYFRRLPGLLSQVWPEFADRYDLALARIEVLAQRFDLTSTTAADDWPMSRRLWQESPLEPQ